MIANMKQLAAVLLTAIGLVSSTITKAEDFFDNEIDCIKINTDMFIVDLATDSIHCFIVEEGMEYCKEHIEEVKEYASSNPNNTLINFGETGIQIGIPDKSLLLTYQCYEDPRDKTKGLFYKPQVFILLSGDKIPQL